MKSTPSPARYRAPDCGDGGMGTMLIAQGCARASRHNAGTSSTRSASADSTRLYPGRAQIILTNSFGGNRFRLGRSDLAGRVDELNRAAAALARAEADAAPGPVVVGGSMGPTGEMLEPYGELSFDDASAAFEAQAAALVAGGVDVLWIETMADLEEVRAAAEGAHRAAPDTPVVMTMTFDTNGRTMMGVSPEKAITALREHGVIALGANCGNGPAEIEGRDREQDARRRRDRPAGRQSQRRTAAHEGDRAVYDATPEIMGQYAPRERDQGAQIIGACCGSTPAHIAAIAAALRD